MRRFKEEKVPRVSQFDLDLNLLNYRYIDVEIGPGVGTHSIKYALKNEDRLLISIEHTKTRYQKFSKRLSDHRKISNLIPIWENAISWITHNLRPSQIDRFFILYPNPYPKSKHLNKRWYAMPFMAKIIDVLGPNGQLILATNEEYYAHECIEYMTKVWHMRLESHLRFNSSDVDEANGKLEHLLSGTVSIPRTLFEKKYLLRGQYLHNIILNKQ